MIFKTKTHQISSALLLWGKTVSMKGLTLRKMLVDPTCIAQIGDFYMKITNFEGWISLGWRDDDGSGRGLLR